MVVHFKDKDPETGETTKKIPLHKPNDQSNYLGQISTYVHQKGSMLKKVELFWPHELLQVIIHEIVISCLQRNEDLLCERLRITELLKCLRSSSVIEQRINKPTPTSSPGRCSMAFPKAREKRPGDEVETYIIPLYGRTIYHVPCHAKLLHQ